MILFGYKAFHKPHHSFLLFVPGWVMKLIFFRASLQFSATNWNASEWTFWEKVEAETQQLGQKENK